MKILQINSVVNSTSTGRIAEDIGRVLLANGNESYIAFGKGNRPSASKLTRIGNNFTVATHVVKTRLMDKHGFGSYKATKKLIKQIEKLQPDAIGLHNLHGYYINIEVLFNYLSESKIPALWTLFDCWAFTGHCSYFDDINCLKWKSHCHECPKYRKYPAAWVDNSFNNFTLKKALFTSPANIQLIVHSHWLANLVKQSFLKDLPIHITPSGVDIEVFKPQNSTILKKNQIEDKRVILGCANLWDNRKGLKDVIKLSSVLGDEYKVVIIGVSNKQKHELPPNVLGIERTESTQQLAEWYSAADVFINPTRQDNFPTTNIEALACGTPVITYNTGGSPEAIDKLTGIVVEKGDINGLKIAIETIGSQDRKTIRKNCRERALKLFNKDDRFMDYLKLYEGLVK
jgi:glycosyltransferase involved in cell wall biosynthesis